MSITETGGNHNETVSNDAVLLVLAGLEHRLDHFDEQMHRLTQFLDRWEPVIEKYASPGKAILGYLPGRKKPGD